jgi:2-polyprenyl-3-methyl-5-hydroxy-6-metoxy-1,4-benzoquinol methylase
MIEATNVTADEIIAQRDALSQRLAQAMQHTLELFTIYLGDRLGLYQALASGPLTSHELADRTGTHERYVREWLEQQTVAGILVTASYDDDGRPHRYALPAGHREALTETDSAAYVAPIAQGTVSVVRPIAAVLDAFRTGAGVPFEAYGPDCVEGMARMNRSGFLNLLGTHQLPLIEDVHARLQADPPARIAEIGCGAGWSSIGIARAYPKVHIDAFEIDPPSVTMARANVEEVGMSDRITIHQHDVRTGTRDGDYDLVIAVNCIHDMGDPIAMLRTMRDLAGDGGVIIDAEPAVAEQFTGEANEAEAFIYAASLLHCLPVGMSEQSSAATGMAMRPSTLRRYAQDAGFRDIELLPIHFDESGLAFYRMLD